MRIRILLAILLVGSFLAASAGLPLLGTAISASANQWPLSTKPPVVEPAAPSSPDAYQESSVEAAEIVSGVELGPPVKNGVAGYLRDLEGNNNVVVLAQRLTNHDGISFNSLIENSGSELVPGEKLNLLNVTVVQSVAEPSKTA